MPHRRARNLASLPYALAAVMAGVMLWDAAGDLDAGRSVHFGPAWVVWWFVGASMAVAATITPTRGPRFTVALMMAASGAWRGALYIVEIGAAGVVPAALWAFAVASWFAWVAVVEDYLGLGPRR